MKGWVVLLVSFLLVPGAACKRDDGSTPPPSRTAVPLHVPGCYAIFDQDGRPASDSLYFAPAKVQVHSAPVTGPTLPPVAGSTWRVTKLDGDGRPIDEDPRRPGFLRWSADSLSDTVRILFHTGFSGTELIIDAKQGPDTLRGRAIGHWDMGPPFETDAGPVTLVRIPCVPAPLQE